ncbi:hypothetical protein ACK8HH_03900 [Gordonia sp. LUNF6]|uniref:hypothetical protein n=1 Tax=Gordonia TaxID=2053 RepID=UPI0005F0B1F6|nr:MULTISPECIES: hypothetical protein [Gordonia]KJR05115.1 hypothetical protein UG54_17520 [Gordonia sihwensis]KXT57046.1 hypothetical protein Y710_09660 [Gordonia sp. QH-12]
MAASNDFGPDDFDRFAREAGEGLRKLLRQALDNPRTTLTWADIAASATRPRTSPEPEQDAGIIDAEPGVWAIVRDDGGPRVERVFATELEALRANQQNTDPARSVQFLEFGADLTAN